MVHDFDAIPDAIPNVELRAQINNYFRKMLPKRPKREEEQEAKIRTLLQFPELIDYFVKYKEDHGRLGRKPAMILSFWLMGVAIAGLALTPPRAIVISPGWPCLFELN